MQYKPLKKTIRFSEKVQNNPCFPQVKLLLKACGDNKFKDWLFYYIDNFDETNPHFNSMNNLRSYLSYLVSREVELEPDILDECKSYFFPTLNVDVLLLLEQALSFFCELQEMERAIQDISQKLSHHQGDSSQSQTSFDDVLPRNAINKGIKYK